MAFERPTARQRNPPQGGSKDSGITALIDADVIAYSIGYACETKVREVLIDGKVQATFESAKELKEWKEKFGYTKEDTALTETVRVEAEPLANCLHSVKVFINSVLDATNAQYYKLYLTGEGNFREEVATILPYKGNRKQEPPVHKQAIRDYLVDNWGAEIIEGMEADDALSIEQYQTAIKNGYGGVTDCWGSTVICTIDKDLRMVPGWHYNWNKDEKAQWVSEEDGIYWFYKQLLMGDRTDNIQGIKGIGPKKAEKILEECDGELSMYLAVYAAYATKYIKEIEARHPEDELDYHADAIDHWTMTELLENAYLLFMIRELDSEGKPRMWEPPE